VRSDLATLTVECIRNQTKTDEDGKPLTFGRSFGRNLAKIASALTIGFGFFMALWTKKRQALHDQLADCRVVLYEEERAASPSRKAAPAAG
jgi:hypothetical protein